MRNLKRVLSLALASIMLLGMMVIGASAADKTYADLTDKDEIQNTAAVSLLVDLGIITGKPDGSYAPKEIVDRATMSKLITYIMMGDVDPSSFAGTTTPLKDIGTSWAEGYIKYCYANGIVSGDGKGSFFPTKEVTVVEAAKMLLVALGNDAGYRGYANDASWSVNIIKDAQKAGLMKGIEGVKSTDGLTRDNAAQMIYNALFAKTVENTTAVDLNGNKYVQSSKETDDTLGEVTYDLKSVTGILVATPKAAIDGANSTKDTVRIKPAEGAAVSPKLSASIDMLGHEVVYYLKGTKLLSSSLVETGKTEVTIDSEGTAYSKYVKNNSLTLADDVKYSDYDTNGSSMGAPAAGDTVSYIDSNGDGKINYVTKMAYGFTTVAKTTAASGRTEATVNFKGVGTYNLSEINGAEGLKKDDMVLYAKVGDMIYVENPKTVEGTITAYKGTVGSDVKSISVDGTSYDVSGIAVGNIQASVDNGVKAKTAASGDLLKATATFYLDKAGSIVYYVKSSDGATNYAYVLSAKKTPAGFGSEGDDTFEAYVILSDGTKATYELTKGSVYGKDDANDGTNPYSGGNTIDVNTICTYSINSDGNMTLKAVENKTVSAATTNVVIEKNKAQFYKDSVTSSNAVPSAFMDKDTIFMFYAASADGKPVTMITGIANIPASTTLPKADLSYVVDDNFVKFVFLKTEAVTKTDKAYAYATGADPITTSDGVEYEFVIDGAIETLLFDEGNTPASYAIDKLYTYTTNDKGVSEATAVSDGSTANTATKNASIKSVQDNYIVLSNDTIVYLANDYTVDSVLSTSDDVITKPSSGSLADGDTITFVTDKDNKLIKAYIVPTPELEAVAITQSGNTLSVTFKGNRNIDSSKTTYQWKYNGSNKGTDDTQAVASGETAADGWTVVVTVQSRTGAALAPVTSAPFTATYTAPAGGR